MSLRRGTRRRLLAILFVALTALLYCALTEAAQADDIPQHPNQAHGYADAVLGPRFHAAVNEFEFRHPQDKAPGSWDHVQRLDAGDVQRWRALIQSWELYRRAMRRAGYEDK